MTCISLQILYYGILMIQFCSIAADDAKVPSMITTNTFHSGGGMVGVASVAEITSKDGKLSTKGGVKFYPPIGMVTNKKSNVMKPWIFSKRTDDGFVMGAVQMYPDAVMASASYGQKIFPGAAMSFASNGQQGNFGQINPMVHWPVPNFFPQTFTSVFRQNPFIPNYMFRNFDSLHPDFEGENDWFRSTHIYDPFINIWR